MEAKLVYDINQIFNTISKEKLGVNEIIKKTGLPRNKGLEAISFLESSKIIMRLHSEKHKQKNLIELTELGKELTNFFKNLEQFETHHEKLVISIKENFNLYSQKFRRKEFEANFTYGLSDEHKSLLQKEYTIIKNQKYNILSSKGWTKEEVKNLEDWNIIGNKIKKDFLDMVVDFIGFRYHLFLVKYNDINKKTKELLKKLIELKINFYIEKKIELLELEYEHSRIRNDDNDNNSNDLIESLNWDYMQYLVDNTSEYIKRNQYNRFIVREVSSLLLDLLSIANLEKNQFIKWLESQISVLKRNPITYAYGDELEKALDFYKKL